MTPADPILGTGLHAVGAMCAALCYTPQKAARGWSWQTFWLAQASVCWLILPVVGAWLTVPELLSALADAPVSAMGNSFLLGMLYGVGGTAFGLAIRYIGFSMTYALAIGISCVLGTLIPPMINGQLEAVFGRPGAGFVLGGIGIGVCGILLTGLAGRFKETDIGGRSESFNLAKGIPLSVLAGVLSAVYGFSLAAGQPIADAAARHGAGQFENNAVYIFSNSGAFVTTAIYCLWLHLRHRTMREYVDLPAGIENRRLPVNFSMAVLTGCLWYGQFFFYGLGHVRMGEYKFSSWGIHMIMLVLFSTFAGIFLREWISCRPRTRASLALAVLVLIAAVLCLAYGNYLGEAAPAH